MAGYFNEYGKGKWSVQFYYYNANGEKKRKRKLGFKTKREAKQWMEDFIAEQEELAKPGANMLFSIFIEEYLNNVSSDLRQSTLATKKHIVEMHIVPYFKDKKISEITAIDIKKWQSEIKKKGFSETYLKTIHAQLSAIMNYAVKYYHLGINPCYIAGGMGKNISGCKGIWKPSDMDCFLREMENEPEVYYAFLLIYWTGMRLGELLALNVEDLDLENKCVRINKSFQKLNGKEVITEPKTEKSNRVIFIPEFVVSEMEAYNEMLYEREPDDRLFLLTKKTLENRIRQGADKAGLPRIRIHDLRHSHASLLIEKGVDIITVSIRLGHYKLTTTLNIYVRMFD